MRKTINGFVYDTDSATPVWTYDCANIGPAGFKETLYQTQRSKTFFLVGTGGIFSKYCGKDADGDFISKEKCFPLTRKTAREWAKFYAPNEIVKVFFEQP